MITGETNFHTRLAAEASQIGLVLCGHFASERFAMQYLADLLTQSFPDVTIWASGQERDPLREL
jgi:putative NIF3 family GTP cyclohydrolase 1 type 2